MYDQADPQRGRIKAGAWILIGLITLGTRLLTSVDYVADPDSLRFALGLLDFNLVSLQPHFPGYPVFVGVAKALDLVGLPLGMTFALVGTLATLLLVWGFLRLVRSDVDRPEGLLGAFLILFTPMIWLMGTRYMPDLLGTAVAVIAIGLLVRKDYQRTSLLVLGAGLVGLLCGIRLSYLPLLILPLLVGLIRCEARVVALLALSLGILIWLVPMVLDTGPSTLIEVAERQASGHFSDFGGTFETAPGLDARRVAIIEGIVADGFGGYWSGRGALSILVLAGLAVLFARGVWEIFFREPEGLVITVLGMSLYVAWILLFQNVLYQPRHVLPLLPLLLAPVWAGAAVLLASTRPVRYLVTGFLGIFALTSIILAGQQTSPTAIAQVSETLRDDLIVRGSGDRVRSTPLICWFLQSTGVEAECEPVPHDREGTIDGADSPPEFIVGWFLSKEERSRYLRLTYHHNPYVNSIWPEVPLYVRRDVLRRGRISSSGKTE